MDEGVMKTYLRAEEVFVRGDGAVLHDAAGRRYLDFLGGIAVSALGHAHPLLVAAVQDQVGRVIHLSNLFRHPYTEQVASSLCELTGLAEAFFTNSGAEAVECALKLARLWQRRRGAPQRTAFVALEGGFHGRTLGALSLTHNKKYREPFEPLLEACWVPPGDLAALETALAGRPAALVIEPIQGEGGVRELDAGFLSGARRLCDRTETLLIHDEIQSGCGRTGEFLAADHAGVKPDVVCLAKPIAAGLPMGVCLAGRKAAGTFHPGEHGSTFAGGPLALRAAAVFLDLMKEGALAANVRARGAELRAGLERLGARFPVVREVRGRGLLLGLRLHHSAAEAQRRLYREGLITNCTAGDVIRMAPPFVVTADQVDEALGLLAGVLDGLPAVPAREGRP